MGAPPSVPPAPSPSSNPNFGLNAAGRESQTDIDRLPTISTRSEKAQGRNKPRTRKCRAGNDRKEQCPRRKGMNRDERLLRTRGHKSAVFLREKGHLLLVRTNKVCKWPSVYESDERMPTPKTAFQNALGGATAWTALFGRTFIETW